MATPTVKEQQISVTLDKAFVDYLRGISYAHHRSVSAVAAKMLYDSCGYIRGQGKKAIQNLESR